MAIEGSLVLPIFLLLMMTVLLSLEAVRLQSDMWEALAEAGSKCAASAYGQSDAENINITDQIKQYLDARLLSYLCVEGGREGIQLQDTSSLEQGKIEIGAEYKLASVIWWLPVGEILIEDRILTHSWTGYSGSEEQWTEQEKGIYVYVTETGSRYHMSQECSYLKVQVKAVGAEWLKEGRNKWGAKYDPCSKCKPQKTGTVYVTADGKNYHSYGNCSALKRTVYIILLSEAEGYDACSRCGG
ncbi:MAG: hypothetical protein IJ409_02400 [Lachnospiraceae bacterium]|nr:hypothetical protein [Lachnospiraceae bacterium]